MLGRLSKHTSNGFSKCATDGIGAVMNKNSLSINGPFLLWECVFNTESNWWRMSLFCYINVQFLGKKKFYNKCIYFDLLQDGHSCVFKATKSGTPALNINQPFIFSFMWFDSILFEVSTLDEVELLIDESLMPNHRLIFGHFCRLLDFQNHPLTN